MNVNTLMLSNRGEFAALTQIKPPVKEIFWQGFNPLELMKLPRVAIVGSRKMSNYGQWVTNKLAGELASRGVVIISGLAYGIDSAAHRAALQAKGLTVAVLPSGLDQIYPASHKNLALNIIGQGGSLLSEYVEGVKPLKHHFIARNRIISGLADVLVVAEAAKRSGSLHTANFALEQGKTVMAVPGNINQPGSEGCNWLIKQGATPVTSVEDILDYLNISSLAEVAARPNLDPASQNLLNIIKEGSCGVEELQLKSNLEAGRFFSLLTEMEISGLISVAGGQVSLE